MVEGARESDKEAVVFKEQVEKARLVTIKGEALWESGGEGEEKITE